MKREYSVGTLLLVALTGCGGGGSAAQIASPDPSLQITSANAMPAASAAYDAALNSQQVSSIGTDFGLISSAPGVVSKTSAPIFSVPIPAETLVCGVSGTTTVSGDIADIVTPTISAGDFIVIEHNACDDGFDEVLDGVARIDFDALSGDIFTELVSMTTTLTLTNYQSATSVDVVNSNGAATVTIDTSQLPLLSTSISGNSLAVSRNARSDTLTNFSSAVTVDGNVNPSAYTSDSSGTLDSTELAGVISYSNPVPFTGSGAEYPSAGEFLVTGSSSSLLLIAVDNVNVRIEIDLGADGSVDETINTTWAELTQS